LEFKKANLQLLNARSYSSYFWPDYLILLTIRHVHESLAFSSVSFAWFWKELVDYWLSERSQFATGGARNDVLLALHMLNCQRLPGYSPTMLQWGTVLGQFYCVVEYCKHLLHQAPNLTVKWIQAMTDWRPEIGRYACQLYHFIW